MPHVICIPSAKRQAESCVKDNATQTAFNKITEMLSKGIRAVGSARVIHSYEKDADGNDTEAVNDSVTVTDLGHDCYKIRFGLSKSHRMIVFDWQEKKTIYILFVFGKSDQVNVSSNGVFYMVDWVKQASKAGAVKALDPNAAQKELKITKFKPGAKKLENQYEPFVLWRGMSVRNNAHIFSIIKQGLLESGATEEDVDTLTEEDYLYLAIWLQKQYQNEQQNN